MTQNLREREIAGARLRLIKKSMAVNNKCLEAVLLAWLDECYSVVHFVT
jgi:hypothetical protein